MNPNAIMHALRDHAWTEIRKAYNADCCVDAVAIVLDVLDFAGVTGRALCTKTNIWNKEALAFIELHGKPAMLTDPQEIQDEWNSKNCKWVGVGYATGEPGGYDGHLVALAPTQDSLYLIDVSLKQADRPNHGIVLPAGIIAEAKPEFVAGDEPLILQPEGVAIRYAAEPGRDDWTETPAWKHTKQRKPVVREIIRHAKRIERELQA